MNRRNCSSSEDEKEYEKGGGRIGGYSSSGQEEFSGSEVDDLEALQHHLILEEAYDGNDCKEEEDEEVEERTQNKDSMGKMSSKKDGKKTKAADMMKKPKAVGAPERAAERVSKDAVCVVLPDR